jgi:hypothetical protein
MINVGFKWMSPYKEEAGVFSGFQTIFGYRVDELDVGNKTRSSGP